MGSHSYGRGASYAPLKILLVEDNQHMRAIIGSILNSVGIRNVHEVSEAADALHSMTHTPPDIVLVDFQMRPMDGVDFTRHVRSGIRGINPYTPIIMITGHSQRSKVEAARDAGITEFVAKPLTARALLSRINMTIDRPRQFIRCEHYFGPDRRRMGALHFKGPYRRQEDRNEVSI